MVLKIRIPISVALDASRSSHASASRIALRSPMCMPTRPLPSSLSRIQSTSLHTTTALPIQRYSRFRNRRRFGGRSPDSIAPRSPLPPAQQIEGRHHDTDRADPFARFPLPLRQSFEDRSQRTSLPDPFARSKLPQRQPFDDRSTNTDSADPFVFRSPVPRQQVQSGQPLRSGPHDAMQHRPSVGEQQKGGRGGGLTLLGIAVAGGGIYYVAHLERVPESGRLRFMDVSVAQERQLGDTAFKQTLQQYSGRILPASDRRAQLVTQVAHRIVQAASSQHDAGTINVDHMPSGLQSGARHGSGKGHDGTAWEVFVVKDDTPNAFVLPNGKIFVFTGILPICHDADGLATVLGHEIAHQVARHGAEKMAGSKLLLGAEKLVNLYVGYDGGVTRILLHFLMELPHSRTVELEADKIGLRLMSAACFDPSKAPGVWKRMQEMEDKASGGGQKANFEVLSTHPVSAKREKNMQDWMPEALELRQEAGCPTPGQLSGFQSAAARSGPTPFPFARY